MAESYFKKLNYAYVLRKNNSGKIKIRKNSGRSINKITNKIIGKPSYTNNHVWYMKPGEKQRTSVNTAKNAVKGVGKLVGFIPGAIYKRGPTIGLNKGISSVGRELFGENPGPLSRVSEFFKTQNQKFTNKTKRNKKD